MSTLDWIIVIFAALGGVWWVVIGLATPDAIATSVGLLWLFSAVHYGRTAGR